MKLLTLGDSFTYGEELAHRNSAWPYVLGKKLDFEVTNLAIPGGGNTQIVRTAVQHAENFDLIIIGWSHWGRIEFADNDGIYDVWPGCQGKLFTHNVEHRLQVLNYIDRYHNDEYLIKQFFINVILLQNYLTQKNKRYLMLTAFGVYDIFLDEKYANLLNQITKTYYVGWPETMMQWTWQLPKGKYGHFLDQGHNVIAEKIYEHIRHLGWIS